MLSQIETLKANPTIAVLWKISAGLDVSFSEVLGGAATPVVRLSRRADARYLYSDDRSFRSRPLLAGVPGHRVELYELRLLPGAVDDADPHPPGTSEQIFCQEGGLRMDLGTENYELGPGDALLFPADRPHRYECTTGQPFVGLSLILYA